MEQHDEILELLNLEEKAVVKPDISNYPEIFDINGNLILSVNDKIVIELYINFSKKTKKYLHTRRYIIKEIDKISGDVKLFDEDMLQSAFTNIFKAIKAGDVIKLCSRAIPETE